jgi:hypothetical protein
MKLRTVGLRSNQRGGIYLHLHRSGKSLVNFGNANEFAIIDDDGGTEPTGVREHVNVPMEKVARNDSDHLFPEFNTHIRAHGKCKLPSYLDEDDGQNGVDHVDGYRSIFLAISPWIKHEHVSHVHTSLASITQGIDFSRPDDGEALLQRAILASEGLPRKEARR